MRKRAVNFASQSPVSGPDPLWLTREAELQDEVVPVGKVVDVAHVGNVVAVPEAVVAVFNWQIIYVNLSFC